MRVAILYDCLYPHTVGGAERWYRHLAERLARRHEVTYVTRRQWGRGESPDAPTGVEVVAVSGGRRLYTRSGRRRISAPLRFGWGCFWHLLRNRHRYDVVHTAAFPYFSLLAARAARALGGPPVAVDWHEVWSRAYWREYLGPLGGIGYAVQRLCVRLTETAFAFSRLHAARLREEGLRGEPVVLPGEYAGPFDPENDAGERSRSVLFAGRFIPEKRVTAVPAALAEARRRDPSIAATMLGDGPERPALAARIAELGLANAVECPGFVDQERLRREMARAMCLLLPSRREGYGAVVVEAAALGTPSIVVAGPDNAATELIEPGVNGLVAPSDSPEDLAGAILEIAADPERFRRSTREWLARRAAEISVDASLAVIEATYLELAGGG